MKPSQQLVEQYRSCRDRKFEVERKLRLYLRLSIALAGFLFVFSLFAGALQSKNDILHGPEKFYFAMAAGAFQIISAIITIVLSFIAASGKRLPTLILIAYNLIFMILTAVMKSGALVYLNEFNLLLGLGLNLWVQTVFSEDDALREMPGYPLFSIDADFRAEYEAPIYVTQRQSSQNMDTVGTAPAAAPAPQHVTLQKQQGSLTENDLSDFTVPAEKQVQTAAAPQLSGEIALEAFSAEQHTGSTKEEIPALSAESMLADMNAIPSKPNYHPDESALPSAEEVLARLASMKRDQQNGGQ